MYALRKFRLKGNIWLLDSLNDEPIKENAYFEVIRNSHFNYFKIVEIQGKSNELSIESNLKENAKIFEIDDSCNINIENSRVTLNDLNNEPIRSRLNSIDSDNEYRVVLRIPTYLAGQIIGAGGKKIEELKNLTRCKIKIDSNYGLGEIIGTKLGVDQASRKIQNDLTLKQNEIKETLETLLKESAIRNENYSYERIINYILTEGVDDVDELENIIDSRKLHILQNKLKTNEFIVKISKRIRPQEKILIKFEVSLNELDCLFKQNGLKEKLLWALINKGWNGLDDLKNEISSNDINLIKDKLKSNGFILDS